MDQLQIQKRTFIPTYGHFRDPRPILIDGSNIGYAYTRHKKFTAKGIFLCVMYFLFQGFPTIRVFLPDNRQGKRGTETHTIITDLYNDGFIYFTPSRKLNNIRRTCYTDRILLEHAFNCKGVVVSNDKFRDMYLENCKFREVIENRHIMIMFVDDRIIIPIDQYGNQCRQLYLENILYFPNKIHTYQEYYPNTEVKIK